MDSHLRRAWLTSALLALVLLAGSAFAQDKPKRGGQGERPDPAQMFAKLDKNEDGVLTEDEVPEKLWERLVNADKDGDGRVTADELKAARGGGGAGQGQRDIGQFFARMDQNGDGAVTEDEAPKAWARLSVSDADGDGKITLEEFKATHNGGGQGGPGGREGQAGPAALFAKLDLNQDGVLTAEEVPGKFWELLSKADADADGKLTAEELGATKGAGREGREGREGRQGQPGDPTALFKEFDKNEDGALTQDEVPEMFWERMSKADADGDGRITLEEMKAAPGLVPGGGPGQGQRDPAAMFQRMDHDGDGKLTEKEVPGDLWERLSKADKDGDGAVTLAELTAARAAHGNGQGKDKGKDKQN